MECASMLVQDWGCGVTPIILQYAAPMAKINADCATKMGRTYVDLSAVSLEATASK
jgi:hypothetical protein